ncbi:MAG: TlpA disulfide reductase family protein [Acidimicrobiia bacterium]|nr:TlpA disulfide reductase family protein [Acidimicrobiia bacterium]
MSIEPGPLPRRGGLLSIVFLVAVGAAVIIAAVVSTRDDPASAAAAVQGAAKENAESAEEVFHPPGGPLAGTLAADFDVELLSGETFDLSDHLANDGRPIVLNFWASWCPPCRAEMPDFDRVALERSDILILGVAVEDDPGAATAFGNEIGVSYPLGIDVTGVIAGHFPYLGLPTTWFIDGDGIIIRQWTGMLTYEDLIARIDADFSS